MDRFSDRFDKDNLKQWLDSGLPFSVITSNSWYGQLDRMMRFKERAIEATNEDDSLDFTLAFFQSCYHLREWIPLFENINKTVWGKKWERFINRNDCIKYCRDICNISKHLKLTKASTTPLIVITREFEEDGTELGKFIGWTLHVESKKMDLFELMDECVEAWIGFIKGELWDSLLISKYLDPNSEHKDSKNED